MRHRRLGRRLKAALRAAALNPPFYFHAAAN